MGWATSAGRGNHQAEILNRPNQRRHEHSKAAEQQHAKSAAIQRRSTRVSSQSAKHDKREQRNADHRIENRMLWYLRDKRRFTFLVERQRLTGISTASRSIDIGKT